MIVSFAYFILLIFALRVGADWKSERRYDKSTEAYILRKGGLSQRIKRLNGPFLIGRIYIAPEMRNRISITNTLDLLSYTICEKTVKEVFANMSTRTYTHVVCPNETPEILRPNTIKEYCCVGIMPDCCNFSKFMSMMEMKRGATFSFRALFSVIGFFIFIIVILIVIKVMFGSRIRNRFSNTIVFRQRGPMTTNNYQHDVPLMHHPNDNYSTKSIPPQQYPMNPYGNPNMAPPVIGQYPQGPPPPAQYPYGAPTFYPQYPPGPPPAFAPYPPGLAAPQNSYPTPTQPPPDYERAIRQ